MIETSDIARAATCHLREIAKCLADTTSILLFQLVVAVDNLTKVNHICSQCIPFDDFGLNCLLECLIKPMIIGKRSIICRTIWKLEIDLPNSRFYRLGELANSHQELLV
jgi:hypothetical protein